jgi:hypothetical protein
MFREFTKCDEQIEANGASIHLATLQPEVIKAVYFGYAYDVAKIEEDAARLKGCGSAPAFYKVEVNRKEGTLTPKLLF